MTEEQIRGTKNLGLIQAIHAGTSPPLNTKIIWYDDNLGQKIHKYYKVEISQWVPFGGSGSITINGHYVYIAYSSNCSGADFDLDFDSQIHKYCSIHSSVTAIPVQNVNNELFEGRWIPLCSLSKGGNYTYIAFADNSNGDNFSLEPTYEVDCAKCDYVDLMTSQSENLSFVKNQDGFNVTIQNLVTPTTLEIDLSILGELLQINEEHCIELQIPILRFNFNLSMDSNEAIGYQVVPNGFSQILNFKLTNKDSKLYINLTDKAFVDSFEFFIKIGTSGCCSKETTEKCFECRTCIGIITSTAPIVDLIKEHFEGKWFCVCCDKGSDNSAELDSIKNLINNIYENQQLINTSNSVSIQNLTNQIQNLNQQIQDYYSNTNQSLNSFYNQIQQIVNNQNNIIDDYYNVLQEQNTIIQNFIDEYNNQNPIVQQGVCKVFGNLDFSWGGGDKKDENVLRSVVIDDEDGVQSHILRVFNLIIKIPYWNEISKYEPILLIDRYKRKGSLGSNRRLKSGFKHETNDSADLSGRISELQISQSINYLNFIQEKYFGYVNGKSFSKGMGSRNKGNSNTWFQDENDKRGKKLFSEAYVYLSFRLRLKISNEETIETGSLGILKMYILNGKITYKIQ